MLMFCRDLGISGPPRSKRVQLQANALIPHRTPPAVRPPRLGGSAPHPLSPHFASV